MNSDAGPSRRTTRSALKRPIATTGITKDEPLTTSSKRPALASAFAQHVSQSSSSRQLLAAQTQVSELQRALNEKEAAVERLEADRRWLAKKEEDEREAREKEGAEWDDQREQYESTLTSLRSQVSDLQESYDDLQSSHSTLQHQSHSSIAQLKSQLAEKEHDARVAESRLEDERTRARDAEAKVGQLEDKVEELERALRDEEGVDVDGERVEVEDVKVHLPVGDNAHGLPASDNIISSDDTTTENNPANSPAGANVETEANTTTNTAPDAEADTSIDVADSANTSSTSMSITSAHPFSLPLSSSSPSHSHNSHHAPSPSPSIAHSRRTSSSPHPTRPRITKADTTLQNHSIIRLELSRQTTHLRTLESTNARLTAELTRLREKNTSVEVLKEEKRELERRVRGVEELRKKVGELEELVGGLEKERDELKKSTQGATGIAAEAKDTPVAITQALANLRTQHALLLDEHGQVNAALRASQAEFKETQTELTGIMRESQRLSAEVAVLREDLGREKRGKKALEREVVFLKDLVANYDTESSLTDPSASSLPSDSTSKLEQRIRHLEEVLQQYKEANQVLDKELTLRRHGESGEVKELRALLQKAEEARVALESELNSANSSLATFEQQNETLEQTLFTLRGTIGAGQHVPPNTRVLCLKENPAQEWADTRREVLERLKAENEALLKRLGELQARVGDERGDGGDGSEAKMVPRESYDAVSLEKKELEEVVKQKEIRLLRLKQIYNAKSAEFREAIASILGLKLAFYPNGQVRVTSMYDLEASFVFQPTSKPSLSPPEFGSGGSSNMTMQLIATSEGGPEDLEQLMRYWVQQEQCIPGFLASVTLECYEKVKRSV